MNHSLANQAREIRLDGRQLTLSQVASVARGEQRPIVRLGTTAASVMNSSNEAKRSLIADNIPIYGVTSGFGDSNTRQISGDKAASLQENLLRFLGCGSGPETPPEVVRATMLVRANCLARGYSAIRPELVDLLLNCLNRDILPVIPERGSVGASGDLVPLSYIARMLVGEGEVRHGGAVTDAAAALRAEGLEPIPLEAKEGLALVNGTSFMSGFAVLASADAAELAYVADLCTAMTCQVLHGNPGHFDEFLFRQKPHPGVLTSSANVRRMLGYSPTTTDDAGPLDGNGGWQHATYRQLDRPIQDRYSIRCAPHVVGILQDTLSWLDQVLTVEINSSNDNPLFDEHGSVLNGGNFYGGHVGQVMDSLKIATASVGDLLDRQLELVVDEKFNNGLTPNLIPHTDPDDWDAGLHHGFKGMQLTASANAAEALRWTMPATSFSRSTEAHNQDKVSMGSIAARDARSVIELVSQVAAVQLIALSQAADLRSPEQVLSPATAAAHAVVRKYSPFLDGDRPMEQELANVARSVRCGEFRRVVTETIGSAEAVGSVDPVASVETAMTAGSLDGLDRGPVHGS